MVRSTLIWTYIYDESPIHKPFNSLFLENIIVPSFCGRTKPNFYDISLANQLIK